MIVRQDGQRTDRPASSSRTDSFLPHWQGNEIAMNRPSLFRQLMNSSRTCHDSLEQPRRELAEVVSPVDPGMPAAADVNLVLDAVLVQSLLQTL